MPFSASLNSESQTYHDNAISGIKRLTCPRGDSALLLLPVHTAELYEDTGLAAGRSGDSSLKGSRPQPGFAFLAVGEDHKGEGVWLTDHM